MQLRDASEFLGTRLHWILSILAEGRVTLSVPEATQWKALALTRWQLLEALRRFNACKRDLLLTPLIASEDAEISVRARKLECHNEDLQHDYDAFVQRWALTSPLSVNERYSADALTMLSRIEQQVIADVQEIDSLTRLAEDRSDAMPGPLS